VKLVIETRHPFGNTLHYIKRPAAAAGAYAALTGRVTVRRQDFTALKTLGHRLECVNCHQEMEACACPTT
jgi:hypothetical protein